MSSNTKVTLLFAHGGGFCKDTWDPITRRLSESRVLQHVPTDFVTFDFPYHGDKHDSAALQSFEVDLSNPRAPRVWNEKHDLVGWVAAAVQEQVAAWKEKTKTEDSEGRTQHKLIRVGHSMGSAGLWATEVAHPGISFYSNQCSLRIHPRPTTRSTSWSLLRCNEAHRGRLVLQRESTSTTCGTLPNGTARHSPDTFEAV